MAWSGDDSLASRREVHPCAARLRPDARPERLGVIGVAGRARRSAELRVSWAWRSSTRALTGTAMRSSGHPEWPRQRAASPSPTFIRTSPTTTRSRRRSSRPRSNDPSCPNSSSRSKAQGLTVGASSPGTTTSLIETALGFTRPPTSSAGTSAPRPGRLIHITIWLHALTGITYSYSLLCESNSVVSQARNQ